MIVDMLRIVGIALVFLLWTPLSRATTLLRMSLDELVAAASVVAQVHCLESESRWEDGEIWTFTNLEVVETLKGSVPRLLTVRLLGGRVDHVISWVEGVPRFEPGEEVFLLLERRRAGDFAVTGWVQGTFRIRRDAITGQETVMQDSAGFAVFDPATRQFRVEAGRSQPLKEFRQRLAAMIEKQREGREP